jgi:hypothetical protein
MGRKESLSRRAGKGLSQLFPTLSTHRDTPWHGMKPVLYKGFPVNAGVAQWLEFQPSKLDI